MNENVKNVLYNAYVHFHLKYLVVIGMRQTKKHYENYRECKTELCS